VLVLIAGAVRSLRRGASGRAVFPFIGAAFGAAFAILTLWIGMAAARAPKSDVSCGAQPFVLLEEILRFAALGCGIVFLLVVMASALPFVLDQVERRGYVAFVAVR